MFFTNNKFSNKLNNKDKIIINRPLGRVLTTKDNKLLDLTKPNVMGILNITPDSFSDGGKYLNKSEALNKIIEMAKEGADIIDIGAESTRPGADSISVQEELDRLCPLLENLGKLDQVDQVENLNNKNNLLFSIDTSKPEVMQEALKYNIHIINDQRALRERNEELDSLDVVAKANLPVILMHMHGRPKYMQREPKYDNIIDEIYSFFEHRIDICKKFGINKHNIILDPGFGFGKNYFHNASILNHLHVFQELNCPIAVGMSRKSMIEQGISGSILIKDRVSASIALAVMAVERGASIIRVHDVKETRQAIDMAFAILEDGNCIDE